jgi:hypothetical protein
MEKKIFIINVDVGYGRHIYAIFAESFEDAYEKFKKKIKENEEYSDIELYNDLKRTAEGVYFTCTDRFNTYSISCSIDELKETEGLIYLGGYVE